MNAISQIVPKFEELLLLPKEIEWVEFKVNDYMPDEIGEYISALSNSACLQEEPYAYLVFGVEDSSHNVVGTTFQPLSYKIGNEELENWLSHLLNPRVDFKIHQFEYKGHNIVIFQIDATRDTPIKFKNVEYVRVGSYKKSLKDYAEKARKIWNKRGVKDWTAQPCRGASIIDLDDNAIAFLRQKLVSINNDGKYQEMTSVQLLNSQRLLANDIPNNLCMLFLGKRVSAEKLLGDIAKVHWKYEDERNGVVERVDFHPPFLLSIYDIETNIHRFNTYLKDLDLFREDIRQYDNEAVEELLVNAFAHRDWSVQLWIDILQTPTSVSFRNPGIFRADLQAALKDNLRPEYFNPCMAAFFKNVNLMEQEGGGLRKVYNRQLRKGTRIIPKFFDDKVPPFVHFTLMGKIENESFAKLVLLHSDILFDDLLILDKIVSGANTIPTEISKEDAARLYDLGYIDISPGRFRRCYISKGFATKTDTTGIRSRSQRYPKDQEELLIINHLKEAGEIGATMRSIIQIFEDKDYSYDMVYNILRRLKPRVYAKWVGSDKSTTRWILAPSVDNT